MLRLRKPKHCMRRRLPSSRDPGALSARPNTRRRRLERVWCRRARKVAPEGTRCRSNVNAQDEAPSRSSDGQGYRYGRGPVVQGQTSGRCEGAEDGTVAPALLERLQRKARGPAHGTRRCTCRRPRRSPPPTRSQSRLQAARIWANIRAATPRAVCWAVGWACPAR